MGGIDGGGEGIISLVGLAVSSPCLPSLTCLCLSATNHVNQYQLPPLLDTGPSLCLALASDWLVL